MSEKIFVESRADDPAPQIELVEAVAIEDKATPSPSPEPSPASPPPPAEVCTFPLWDFIARKFDESTNLESVVADTGDMPNPARYFTFIIYMCVVAALAAYFFSTNYIKARTESFITLDKKSGVCKDDSSLDYCCEVPTSVTGTFLADSSGRWNSEPFFSYTDQIYGVTMTALQYTNTEWKKLMRNIQKDLHDVGRTKGQQRDLAWNFVAWSSFSAISETKAGALRFFAAGDVAQVYDKPVFDTGFASAYSDSLQCSVDITASFSPGSRTLEVVADLTKNNAPEAATTTEDLTKNPCPHVLNPGVMTNNPPGAPLPSELRWSIDMTSVNTALAVNLGIVPLGNLEEFSRDTKREKMMSDLRSVGRIDDYTFNRTSSYFDYLYSPMAPIYCVNYTDIKEASCLVRIGNMLFYPTIVHFGYYDSPDYSGTLSPCSASAVASDPTASIYCNLFDVVVSLIYYPSANDSSSTLNVTRRALSEENSLSTLDATNPNHAKIDLLRRSAEARLSAKQRKSDPFAPQDALTGAASLPDAPKNNLRTHNRQQPHAHSEEVAKSEMDIDINEFYFTDDAIDYGGGGGNDDESSFFPPNAENLDVGLIFDLARYSAEQRHANKTSGDLAVSSAAYYASIATVERDYFPGVSYTEHFDRLCSPEANGLSRGCAMFSVELYGGLDLTISEFNYQPINPSFANTLYHKKTMDKIVKEPPTRLTQEYYSCVLSKWDAFFQATGLAASNTQLYVSIFLMTYLFLLVNYLRRSGKNALWKHEKERMEELEKHRVYTLVQALEKDIKSGNLRSCDATITAIRELDEDEAQKDEAQKHTKNYEEVPQQA